MANPPKPEVQARVFTAARRVRDEGQTILKAAQELQVSRDSVNNAMVVLRFGTEEDVRAAESATVGLRVLADQLRRKRDDRTKNHLNAELWSKLAAGIKTLSGLPAPESLLPAARIYGRSGDMDARISKVIGWLTEYERLRKGASDA